MGTKNLNSATNLITFTRASGGTALRKISYGNELVTNGDFSSGTTGWVDGTTYSGALDASSGKLLITTDSSSGYGSAIQGVPLVVGKAYRLTGSRRAVSGGNPAIGVSNSAGTVQVVLLSGSASTVTNDFSVTFVASSTFSLCLFNQSPTNGNSSEFDNVSVKEVLYDQPDGTLQLFNSPANVPRIEYDATGAVKGLLIEEARTNLLPYSLLAHGSGWTQQYATLTLGATTAPDGTSKASSLVESTSTSKHQCYSTGIVTGVTTTYSIWIKANTRSEILVSFATAGQAKGAFFNLLTGEVGTVYSGYSASIVEGVDGWYRCSVTFTPSSSGTYYSAVMMSVSESSTYTGDGTSGIYLWGAQLEVGSFPSSYIPTTGSTATRAADDATILRSSFGHHNEASTWVVEFTPTFPSVDTNQSVLYRYGSGYDFLIWSTSANYMTASYMASASSPRFPITANQTSKIAVVLKHGEYLSVCVDGGSISQNSVLSNTTIHTDAVTGQADVDYKLGGDQLGHIKSIKYYPRSLTNTQLQELTT